MARRIKVLVVDDSALVRQILTAGLASDSGLEVVGSAADPYAARDLIVEKSPDVLTLDVEMPRMEGVEFLRRLMAQKPLPVVMVSALTERGASTTLDALEAGAVDFVPKPKSDVARGLSSVLLELRTKIKIASTVNVARFRRGLEATCKSSMVDKSPALAESTDKVIAIGASTGGTEAIRVVLQALPRTAPGVVVVQHMPAMFTKMFAERLNNQCAMEVKEAVPGDRVVAGRVLIAPGGLHMQVVRAGGRYLVEISKGPLVNGHSPSVEVLMQSVAKYVGANAVGAMLTGMGGDGAEGLLSMRRAGAHTFAQNEATCVVFGMPKVAWEKGAAERLLPLEEIGPALLAAATRPVS